MSQAGFRIHIKKEELKFASSHMTVFPDGTKERLHGHNYRTEVHVDLADSSLQTMISFAEIKSEMSKICREWDEKLLLAAECPFFKITMHSQQEIDFTLCGKRYVLPTEDVVLLPMDNVTTEALAREFTLRLTRVLGPRLRDLRVSKFEVRIDEMTGQGASYFWYPENGTGRAN